MDETPASLEKTETTKHRLEAPATALLESLQKDKLIEDSMKKETSYEEIQQDLERPQAGAASLLDSKDIELKTELSHVEILSITQLRFMANRYNIPSIHDFCDGMMRLKVSFARKGRREYIDGLHADQFANQGKDMSPVAALLGKITGGNR